MHAKKKISTYKNSVGQTGGGKTDAPVPSPLEEKIGSTLSNTCLFGIVPEGQGDSDAIPTVGKYL